jgi:hypothetical protein
METNPTTISPAAVIKATLESARQGRRPDAGLMAPPPAELLEDKADLDVHPADEGPQRTVMLNQPSASASGSVRPPPPSERTAAFIQPPVASVSQSQQINAVNPLGSTQLHSQPPPRLGPSMPPHSVQHAPHSVPPAPPSMPPPMYGYGMPVPPGSVSGSVSVPGVAMSQSVPAHFMVPQAPYSDQRNDPPGMAMTGRHKAKGRSPASWAAALLAFGLFVGVGAVAVLQSNSSLADTTASFVDPSRAPGPKAGAQPPATTATPAVGAPVVAVPPADPNAPPAQPPVANANPNPPPAPPPATVAANTPAVANPPAPAQPPAPPPPEPKPETKPEPKAKHASGGGYHPPAAPKPPAEPKPTAEPKPAPPPPPAKTAVAAKEPAEDPPAKGGAKPGAKPPAGKAGGDKATDEEMKKALEALQKAQMEGATFDK